MAESRGEHEARPAPVGVPGTEYRIDELARAAGTTVRNVRAYQDRGILPGPRRVGRVGWYSEAHLGRLRLIATLLDRGYTLANIGELLAAWERGQDLGALLGLEAVLVGSWAPPGDGPEILDASDLVERFGPAGAAQAARAVEAGVLEPAGPGRFSVSNPAALEVGELLSAAGVPLEAALAVAGRLRLEVEGIARHLVDLVDEHLFAPHGAAVPPADVARLARLVAALQPLAPRLVATELSRAMEREVRGRFGERLAGALGAPGPAEDPQR